MIKFAIPKDDAMQSLNDTLDSLDEQYARLQADIESILDLMDRIRDIKDKKPMLSKKLSAEVRTWTNDFS